MTSQENENLQILQQISAIQSRYVAGEIGADEFGGELAKFLAPDVVFWSNYTPSWEPLRPLFATRHGPREIADRYVLEHELETIEPGTTPPFDICTAADVAYLTVEETASWFGRRPVTFTFVLKVRFQDGTIKRLDMYLDPTPIEQVYAEGGEP